MKLSIESALQEAAHALDELRTNQLQIAQIESAAVLLSECLRGGGKVIAFGNGGSMCDAMHFAEELSGKYRRERPALGAIALSDPGFLTCVANDFGYQRVFSRGIEALGRSGDVAVGFSTSGRSPNVVAALETARQIGMGTVLLTGNLAMNDLVDIAISTPGGRFADRVQELHIKIVHILIELVENSLFGE